MKVEKRGNSYRVQKTIDGKRVSLTFDHKPTQKEIADAILLKRTSKVTNANAPKKSFEECAKKYLEVKENVLSASTLRSYITLLNNLPESFTSMAMEDIDQVAVQKVINDIAAMRSAKTCKNYNAFISSVLTMFMPDMVLKTTLPKAVKNEMYIPTSEEIKAVLDSSNEKYYIVFMLGCYGLRRSEILPLNWPEDFDVENNLVHINKAMVRDVNNEWVVQNFNKTTESKRDVPISPDLIDRIAAQGYVFKGYPGKILEYLNRRQDILELPRFKFHALRHYFATELDQAGFSSKDIQKLGGWSSDNILKTVDQHNRVEHDKAIQKKASDLISNNLR